MKFFALAILPTGVDISSEASVLAAAEEVMWPHRDRTSFPPGDDDETPNLARWDGYTHETRLWLVHYGYDPGAIERDEDVCLIRASEIVDQDFGPSGRLGEAAVVTPEGDWIEYDFGPGDHGDNLCEEAACKVRSYSEHFGVLLFCRR